MQFQSCLDTIGLQSEVMKTHRNSVNFNGTTFWQVHLKSMVAFIGKARPDYDFDIGEYIRLGVQGMASMYTKHHFMHLHIYTVTIIYSKQHLNLYRLLQNSTFNLGL